MKSNGRRSWLAALASVAFIAGAANTSARTYHVDATNGDDRNDGATPATAWRSLVQVNQAELKPGDVVRFKRGDTWRGQLIPQSGQEGAPITYGAYGQGDKPLLLGSASRSEPKDWQPEGDRIWATAKLVFTELPALNNLTAMPWAIHTEGGAKVESTIKPGPDSPPGVQLACVAGGSTQNQVQLHARGFKVSKGDYFQLTFRARSTKPFAIPAVRLHRQNSPYTNYGTGVMPALKVDVEWKELQIRCRSLVTAEDGRITLMLGGALPAGAVFDFQPVSWTRMQADDAAMLAVDVGNIIFDHGRAVGVKKWKPEDLQRPGDYWYSAETGQVKLCAESNPAELYRSIELALSRHIVSQGNRSHVTYENLAVKYGAAHGFGGASTHHLIIRQCDIAWIGGGHQLTTPEGRPVRFGNGIEFWSEAHDNLVEGCRLWEIYDAALTNQGNNNNTAAYLTYRHNVIWNSEYSFEYWNGKKAQRDAAQRSQTHHIRFEYNTCVNAGYGWGHAQRPDPNGRHLMFYNNPVPTTGFYIRNNIFYQATESGARFSNDWAASLIMDHNCWYQPRGTLILFLKTPWAPAQFGEYQKQTKLDAHSRVADPRFVNASALDFRLSADSPALTLSTEGGPVGAQPRLP